MATNQDQMVAASLCSDDILDKVKKQLEQLIEKNKDQIDEDDYRSLLDDTKLFKRYIKRKHEQIEPSAQFIFDALQWRKKLLIHNYKEHTDFPREFYEVGGLYLHGRDVNGTFLFF